MRVASSQYQTLINISIQQNQERINFLTQQMSSGLRIQLPSDDPIGNVRISRLTREQAMVTQYKENIASVKTRLLKNEYYLSRMVTDMGAAAIDLNGYQTALQATYKAYAKVGNISLFDLL